MTTTDQTGIFFINSQVLPSDVTDGLSQTILFGERNRIDPNAQTFYNALQGWCSTGNYVFAPWSLIGAAEPINWTLPQNPSSADRIGRYATYGSNHFGGATFCMADGSVQFLSDGMPLSLLQGLSTRGGGEVIAGFP